MKQTQKQKQITTTNLAEVLYLLDRGHKVREVRIEKSTPYQILELQITCEGPDIDLDHGYYLVHGTPVQLSRLPEAFDAVMAVVWLDAERGQV